MTTPPAPTNPVMVLANGIRVPLVLRHLGYGFGVGEVWQPVIEGDIEKLMPLLVALDADEWPSNTSVKFPGWSGGTYEWAQRVLAASPILKGGSNITAPGYRATK